MAARCHVGDLCGVEELAARTLHDYVCEHGLSDAGDEVADVFFAGKRRHGVEVGAVGCLGGIILVFAFCTFCLIDAYPGAHAAGDGWVCGGGEGYLRLDWGGGGLNGFCHVGFLI